MTARSTRTPRVRGRAGRRFRAAAAALVLGILTAAGLAAASPAVASGGGQLLVDLPGDHRGWVGESSRPLLTFHRLAPGVSTAATMGLQNNSGLGTSLTLRATDVQDDDNGCLPQENRAGDTTCGKDGGELGSWLRLTVTRTDGPDGPIRLWTGTVLELEHGARLAADVPAHAQWQLQVTAALPHEAGNELMSDQVGFGLRWTLANDGSSDSTEVLGVKVDHTLRLPLVGWPLWPSLSLALALALSGVAGRWAPRGLRRHVR